MKTTQKDLEDCIKRLEKHTEDMEEEKGVDYDLKHAKVSQSEKEVVKAAKAILKTMKDAQLNF